jgi:tRNA 2-selenouridine synthase SelU
MHQSIDNWNDYHPKESTILALNHSLEILNQIEEKFLVFCSSRSDGDLLVREFTQTINLLKHACKRGLFGYGSMSILRN